MDKQLKYIVCLMICVVLMLFTGLSLSANPIQDEKNKKVSFEDPKLEEIIRSTINMPTGDIYQSDLKGIKELVIDEKQINSVKGIEHLENLTSLQLTNNSFRENVIDIEPISKLTNLTQLNLMRTNMKDIGPLSKLTNLRELSLRTTSIRNIDAVATLKNLVTLDLSFNEFEDISVLANLEKLEVLYLNETDVRDITV